MAQRGDMALLCRRENETFSVETLEQALGQLIAVAEAFCVAELETAPDLRCCAEPGGA